MKATLTVTGCVFFSEKNGKLYAQYLDTQLNLGDHLFTNKMVSFLVDTLSIPPTSRGLYQVICLVFYHFLKSLKYWINKLASGFNKRSNNRQEVTQPGILVISKFFDHTMKRFSLGSVGLKGAVDRPCIPVQMSCMDFEPTLLPFVRRIITPILGFVEGIAPSGKSCLFAHLTKT